ncbi:MAG: undecaprenyldiphospho-muramoylpentapeptide beta-N-acetylglucosaminyltransferase [Lachnospirales bacterium]
MKKIILTGGGTAGHVTPNIALIPELKKEYQVIYIGRCGENIIEQQLIEKIGIPYFSITSGKLRRYLSIENIKDVFKVLKGFFESIILLKKLKPDIVFSKGGFVTVPVILASKILKIPVVIHESDLTVGLANKISIPIAKEVCTSFKETSEFIKGKGIATGTPIRDELFQGKNISSQLFCDVKPVVLVIGGSLGAKVINEFIYNNLDKILVNYNIIHICGKNNYKDIKRNGYFLVEYVIDELSDYLATADIIISRAGSNSIFELLALKKPNILIPLGRNASRGDQILNAENFSKKGFSIVTYEDDINELYENIRTLDENKEKYIKKMDEYDFNNGIDSIIKVIKKYTK